MSETLLSPEEIARRLRQYLREFDMAYQGPLELIDALEKWANGSYPRRGQVLPLRSELGPPPWSPDDPALQRWEAAHGHDVRLECDAVDGCGAADAEPPEHRALEGLRTLLDAIETMDQKVTPYGDDRPDGGEGRREGEGRSRPQGN